MVSLGLVNLTIKFHTKFIFTREIDVNRLFERNIEPAAVIAPDVSILWHDRPYIQ